MDYSHVRDVDPVVVDAFDDEVKRQRSTLAMIAPENHASEVALEAQGSAPVNKYAEGYPGKHYYAGCEYADGAEALAVERAKGLWGAGHANVQSHSGTQANMGVYLAVFSPGDKILSLDLTHSGHLSHGHPTNSTGKLYDIEQYEVDAETGHIDYGQFAEKAAAFESNITVSGYSTYLRAVEWETIQGVADDVDAFHLADIAHITGLVAAGVHPSPVGVADFVTGSTHKTIRAGRGGIVMCDEKYASDIDNAVFSGAQGGPLMHNIAGKVVSLKEALQSEFEEYAQQVVDNAKALAETFEDHGFSVASGGTDTHLVFVDLHDSHPDLTGGTAEEALKSTGIVLNANIVPGKARSVSNPSGIRAGTPGLTTRGLGEDETREAGELIVKVVDVPEDDNAPAEVSERVQELCNTNPLYE